jgi:uncharacterized phage protein (TIGR01671 family)
MNTDRFKFRVWDNRENWYIQFRASSDKEPFTYILADADGSGNTIDSVFNSGWHNPDDCVIEQCTGIKDQSGKLIYEGDVVDYYCPMADDHYQGVVTFDDNETTASGYYIKGKREGWQSYLDGSHCRIIGNVHEMEK